ncbi:MAG: AAC(3) family N-acetyltransferase [Ruminococcaceae bacterium]|nr:AAC(3) family N-acetyltransferase [Oscillospiraceae bacterium]
MHTKESLMRDLAAMGVDPKGTLFIHSSYKSLGDVEGRADTVLDALMEYMKDGLLVFPAHTWANVNDRNPVMDVLHTPVCVGILPELFRKRPGVKRSLHPTHSVCAIGEGAEEFLAGEENVTTPCPEGGVYHRLYTRGAQILLIGVNFNRNTFIHGVEEWEHLTGTLTAHTQPLWVVDYEGKRHYTPQHRHCAPLISETFWKVEPIAIRDGATKLAKLADAKVYLSDARKLRDTVARIFSIDPMALIDNISLDERF